MLREKQDLKVSQAELLKAKEQEQKEAQEKAKQDESNNQESGAAGPKSIVDPN